MNTVTDYFTYLEQSDFTFLYPDARAVLDFWFNTENAPFWFVANDDFDKKIYDKFGALWQAVCQGERAHWRRDEQQKDDSKANLAGRLAEIIVLDQFSRWTSISFQVCSTISSVLSWPWNTIVWMFAND